ncbi:hypothetical protein MTP99_003273 [Tenebrio molitor]|nr:hypothetical protein MTP99_003273 [Tenebrio molitor]
MKLLLCLVLVALVAATYADTGRDKVGEYSDACKAETGISEETLTKVCNGEEVDDPKLKEHAFCILKKSGFIDASGEFQVEHIKTKLKEVAEHPEKIDALVAKRAVKKATSQESSKDFLKCTRENRL